MTGWRLGSLVMSAVKTIGSSWRQAVLFAVVTAVVMVGITRAELGTTRSLAEFVAGTRAGGAFVVVAASPNGVDGIRCESLAAHDGVLDSGSTRSLGPSSVASAPNMAFESVAVTPGLVSLWTGGPHVDAPLGWVLGSVTASELGMEEGSVLKVNGEVDTVTGVLDNNPMSEQANRWLIRSAAPGRASDCWVSFEPAATGVADDYVRAALSSSGSSLVLGRLANFGDFARDPLTELESRPQANVWLLAGFALGLLAWITGWFRRSEYALYRATGTTSVELWFGAAVEDWLVMVPASAMSVAWTIAYAQAADPRLLGGDEIMLAVRNTGSALLLAMLVAPLRVWLWGRRRVMESLKDR